MKNAARKIVDEEFKLDSRDLSPLTASLFKPIVVAADDHNSGSRKRKKKEVTRDPRIKERVAELLKNEGNYLHGPIEADVCSNSHVQYSLSR